MTLKGNTAVAVTSGMYSEALRLKEMALVLAMNPEKDEFPKITPVYASREEVYGKVSPKG